MRGITVFNSFKEYGKWNGQSIYDVNARLKAGNEEARDEYSGYIAALDALEEKLADQTAGEEVKRYWNLLPCAPIHLSTCSRQGRKSLQALLREASLL